MMLLIRAIIFYLGYWLATLLIGSLSIVLLLLPTKALKKISQSIILLWIDFVLFWLRLCCGVRVKITGNIAQLNQASVIVSNHQSNWETFFLQQHFSPLSTILKQELLSIPFFGWGLRALEPIAIDRGNPMQALKKIKIDGVSRLQQGKHVLVFPEGTRKAVGELGEYKRSAADIAQQAGVPIIPIVHNSGEHWLNKKIIKVPGCVHVIIGEAIETKEKNTKMLMREIHDWTQEQLNNIYSEKV